MLFVVQMSEAGEPAAPAVFADAEAARAAYLALVEKNWSAAYAGYCKRNAFDAASFEAARAFAQALGEPETKRLHYWELSVGGEGIPRGQRQQFLQAARETQKQSLAVRTELHGLSEKLTDLSQELVRLQGLVEEEKAADQDKEKPQPAPAAPQPSEALSSERDEKYQTSEWQDFVQSLIMMCGGNRAEFPLISRHDWRQAVYSSLTGLQYWEWVAVRVDQAIETARNGGYRIEESDDEPGRFVYLTPTEERSEESYDLEDMAWCAAGLHAERDSDPPA